MVRLLWRPRFLAAAAAAVAPTLVAAKKSDWLYGESIIGVTEYSGNQYLVDSLLNDSAAAGYTLPSTRRRRRRLRRFR